MEETGATVLHDLEEALELWTDGLGGAKWGVGVLEYQVASHCRRSMLLFLARSIASCGGAGERTFLQATQE